MSLFLVLLAAGDGKRLKSKVPKPYNKINNKTLLEYSLDAFGAVSKIKKILVVYNKKHTKYLKKNPNELQLLWSRYRLVCKLSLFAIG